MSAKTLLIIATFLSVHAWAEGIEADLVDVSTDVEEIMVDSEAAKAQAKVAEIRAAKEKEENSRAIKETLKAKGQAEMKRRQAQGELKKNETIIQGLLKEQARLKTEMKKWEEDFKTSEKTIADSNAKVEKLKRDNLTAQELTAEKKAKTLEVNQKRDEILKSLRALEAQHATAQQEFKKASLEEAQATKNLEKVTLEETQKKNKLTAEIAQLKARYRQAKAIISAVDKESGKLRQSTAKQEQLLQTARAETKSAVAQEVKVAHQPEIPFGGPDAASQEKGEQTAERRPSSVNEGGDTLTLKKDCNLRETPERSGKFLGVKRGGSSITKTGENEGWYKASVGEGRSGYLLKSCF